MSESPVAYEVKGSPHARISARWLPILFRLAGLQRDRVYNVILKIPKSEDENVTLVLLGSGKEENEG